jgi:hypothetical protein
VLVACVKTGTLYGPEYVNRLVAMLARHTTKPHEVVCLTDDPTGVTCRVLHLEQQQLPGWWAKLDLFIPGLFTERVLYLDLDTVIRGNVDFLFEYDGPLAMLRSFLPPSSHGSAVMSFAPVHDYLYTDFTPDLLELYHGDQDWISARAPAIDCWQDLVPGAIGSYKVDGLADDPRGFPLVCFHGEPKPHQVDGWVRDAWRE